MCFERSTVSHDYSVKRCEKMSSRDSVISISSITELVSPNMSVVCLSHIHSFYKVLQVHCVSQGDFFRVTSICNLYYRSSLLNTSSFSFFTSPISVIIFPNGILSSICFTYPQYYFIFPHILHGTNLLLYLTLFVPFLNMLISSLAFFLQFLSHCLLLFPSLSSSFAKCHSIFPPSVYMLKTCFVY